MKVLSFRNMAKCAKLPVLLAAVVASAALGVTADFINSLIMNGKEIEDVPDLIDQVIETVGVGIKDKGLGITEV